MEKGSLRVDANVSVRRAGDPKLGTKTEVKNLNSFANVERALEVERDAADRVLERGRADRSRTRCSSTRRTGEVRALRSKEESHDYRYFPEPDLPPLVLEPAWIDEQRATLPELPEAKRERFGREHGLPGVSRGDADAGAAGRRLLRGRR